MAERAEQNITALPVKTSSGIAATDYLLGIDSAEGYRMLIQDLGDYIINHVSATLGGSAQTLAAAIGSTYNLVNSTAITSGLDLNTFINPGNYTAANNEAATLVNCPITRAFRMVVERSFTAANVNWVKQRLVKSADGETYERYTVNGGSTWTEWKRIDTDNKNVPHFATGASAALLATDTDINQLLTGEYYWASASYRPSANIPDNTAVRGRLWALDSGGQDIYCTQICYTSNFNWFIRYCTSKSSYTWTEWKRINAGETEYTSLACSYGTLTYKCYKTGRIVSLIATIDVTSNIPANSDVITGLPFTGQTANYTPIRTFNNTAGTYIDLDVHRSGSSACALSTRTAIASGASIRINATYTTE